MEELSVRLIIERMKGFFKVKNDKDLSELIEISKSTLSNWKNRNSMPLEAFYQVASNNKISTDWLLFGQDNKEQLATDEKIFLAAYRQLDQEQKVKLVMQMSGLGNSTNGVSFTANGNDNNQQIIHGSVGEVNGIKKR